MSNTPIENVFEALQNAPNYHPASAQLFTDWLVQAGDVVTVSSDGENFNLPIFNLEMTWNGSSMVSVDATGKEKRDAPSALQRRSYGASQTQADLDGVHSRLVQDENKIGLVVEETSGGNVIRAASIMTAINDDESSVTIAADKIEIYGTLITQDQQGWSISAVSGMFGEITMVDSGSISGAGSVSADAIYSDNIYADNETDRYCLEKDAIGTLRVQSVGNSQYKLQKQTVDNVGETTWVDIPNTTFSRAATITGSWSSGTYTVSATAGTVNALSTTLSNVSGPNSITANGTYTYKVMYEDGQGEDQETGTTKTVTVNVPTGGVPSSSDITIGSYVNTRSEPTASSGPAYTSATLMRDTILAAINNGNWFGFSIFYKSTNTVRRYKMHFA